MLCHATFIKVQCYYSDSMEYSSDPTLLDDSFSIRYCPLPCPAQIPRKPCVCLRSIGILREYGISLRNTYMPCQINPWLQLGVCKRARLRAIFCPLQISWFCSEGNPQDVYTCLPQVTSRETICCTICSIDRSREGRRKLDQYWGKLVASVSTSVTSKHLKVNKQKQSREGNTLN